MWTREVDGRVLTFHLAGINNQNFLMRDDETGSYWQQINGKAVSGPLAGRELKLISTEELSFALWRTESPKGKVLQPVSEFRKWYEPRDWDKQMARAPSIIDTTSTGVGPRTLMIGVELAGASKAYPLSRVIEQKLIQDRVGGKAIFLVAGPDNKSVRAFQREVEGANGEVEFFRKPEGGTDTLTDGSTASEWNFKGCAVSGSQTGHCLKQVGTISDYWFDWHLYHPQTSVYKQ